jgi:hypothetical protein
MCSSRDEGIGLKVPVETELPKSQLFLTALAEEAYMSLEGAIAQVRALMVKLMHDLACFLIDFFDGCIPAVVVMKKPYNMNLPALL